MMPYVIVGAATSLEELQSAMDATMLMDVVQLRGGGIPPLYESGVVYERERREGEALQGVERFQTSRDAYMLGHADCDGLAPWLAAERRLRGDRGARAVVIPSQGVGYHVVVRTGDGRVLDPSARLGMLDGYGVGDDTLESASARRRRRIGALRDRLRSIARVAQRYASNTPQGRAARAVIEQGRRELRGLESQEERER